MAAASLACHWGRYSGLGTNLITAAFAGGTVYWYDWLAKLLFTVVTLAGGFQGGEVTPLFSIGASLGVWLAPLAGVPAPVAAAAGYCAVFGREFLPFGLLCCAAARVCSGGATIYPAQRTE